MHLGSTAHLRKEARLIGRMISKCMTLASAIEHEAKLQANGGAAVCDPAVLEPLDQSLMFFAEFATGMHDAKARHLSDQLLALRGDECVEISRWLLSEQAVLRRSLASVARAQRLVLAGDTAGLGELGARLYRYAKELSDHMTQRDGWLFAMADGVLPPSTDVAMLERFAQIEITEVDALRLKRFVRFAEQPEDAQTFVVIPPRASADGDWRWVGPPGAIDARTLSTGEPRGGTEPMKTDVIFDEDGHQIVRMSEGGHRLAIEANQYLLIDHGEGLVLDPGGPKIFPNVVVESRNRLKSGRLRYVFLSHQDPDVLTSLNAWMIDTDAEIVMSRLWYRFVPHFGIEQLVTERMTPVPDEGQWLQLGDTEVALLPAHFLHSCGNFHLYDPVSRTLFSGDLGASVGADYTTVTDFDAHIPKMLGFHQRYMASRKAAEQWANMVRELEIDRIAPQHGALFEGADMARRLIEWCADLDCGVDLLADGYRVPQRQ